MANSTYSDQIVDKICSLIAVSEFGLRKIVDENPDLPDVATMMRWLADKEDKTKDYFREQYARAKEMQADYMGEKIIEISDDGTNDYMTITKGNATYNVEDREVTSRSKLRVETRKWLMTKLAPKKYGDNLKISGDSENPLTIKLPDGTIKYEAEQTSDTP